MAERASLFGWKAELLERYLSQLERAPERADAVLGELGADFFADDEEWRATFEDLIARPGRDHGLKVKALEEYLHHLTRGHAAEHTGRIAKVGTSERYAETDAPALGVNDFEGDLRTILRGVPARPRDAEQADDFERLPANERVLVRLPEDGATDFFLGRQRFRYQPNPPRWVDPNGRAYLLREGWNFVGRAPFNDVVVNPGYSAVSRRHLILEIHHARLRALVDLSSTGTFVPRDVELRRT